MAFVTTGFRIWGWFDDVEQTVPTYDPPHDAPCPYCFAPITADDVRTHSILPIGKVYAKRSYFYRTHASCDAAAGDSGIMGGRIIDAIMNAGD